MTYRLDLLDLPFEGDDLEWKLQTCGSGAKGFWALIVPYVANRAIMARLDAAVGKLNWKNEFRDLEGSGVECGIAIRCPESGEWIWKWDAAEETDIESVKGGRSNSMKRAAVQWGMGRHLYHIGETWAECSDQRQNGNEWKRGKTKQKQEFWWRVPVGKVSKTSSTKPTVEPNSGEATITNSKPKPVSSAKPVTEEKPPNLSTQDAQKLYIVASNNGWTKERVKQVLAQSGITSAKDIPVQSYRDWIDYFESNLCYITREQMSEIGVFITAHGISKERAKEISGVSANQILATNFKSVMAALRNEVNSTEDESRPEPTEAEVSHDYFE